MTEARTLHEQAMEVAAEAFLLRRRGEGDKAKTLALEAMRLETKAAGVLSPHDAEPARSVLYRSAATLALDAGEPKEAARLAHLGLGGHAPPEIEDELRAVLRRATYEEQSYELSPDEVSVSIDGPDVLGEGFARERDVMDRLRALAIMVKRTADRLSGKVFSDRRTPDRAGMFEVFWGPAKPASYAAVIRFGRQKSLPSEVGPVGAVIDEFMGALRDAQDDPARLAERITDPAYLSNFRALVSQFQPDGRGVQRVGIVAKRRDVAEVVEFTRDAPKEDLALASPAEDRSTSAVPSPRMVRGTLLAASSLSGKPYVTIKGEDDRNYKIWVPEELGMRDILIPLYERIVTALLEVSTTRSGKERLSLVAVEASDLE
jgi:hypothetical protein